MRRKNIALLVLAMLLVVGSVAAVTAVGAEDRSIDKRWRADATYRWETFIKALIAESLSLPKDPQGHR